MRRRMIHNVRMICGKYPVNTAGITHGSNQHFQMQIRIMSSQFLLNIVRIIFIDIKYDKHLWLIGRNLAAQLTTDGTASSGDKNDFIFHISGNRIQIRLYRLASQKVFNLNRTKFFDRSFSIYKLIYTRKNFQICPRLLTDFKDLLHFFFRRTRHRHNNLIDLIMTGGVKNFISSANHLNSINKCVLFGLIVVNHTANIAVQFFTHFKLVDHHISGFSTTDDHRIPHTDTMHIFIVKESDDTIRKTHRQSHKK